MQLRDYQTKAISDLRSSFKQGNKSPLLVMPTGSGKTVVFAEISKALESNKKNVLILVHRKELVDQASNKLVDGRGSLVKQAEILKNLGIGSTKIQFSKE